MAVITEEKLKKIVKTSVEEALDARILKLGAFFLPSASKKEQNNIDRLYKKPSRIISKTYLIKA